MAFVQTSTDVIAERRHDFPSIGQAAYARAVVAQPGGVVAQSFVLSFAVDISPRLELNRLDQAFRKVVARHPEVRASFSVKPDSIRVHWHEIDGFSIDVVDVSDLSSAEADLAVQQRAARGWVTIAEPLIRLTAFEKKDATAVLIEMHHIVVDGWSSELIFRDLMVAYMSGHLLPSPSITYEDFVDREANLVASRRGEELKAFWLKQLNNFGPELALPYSRTRTSEPAVAQLHNFSLSPELTRLVREVSMKIGASVFATMTAAWALALSRMSGADDIPIHVPVARRDNADVHELVGFISTNHCLRVSIEAGEDGLAFVQRVTRGLALLLDHQDYPVWAISEAESSFAHVGARKNCYRQVALSMLTPNRNDQLGLSSLLQDPSSGTVVVGPYRATLIRPAPRRAITELWAQITSSPTHLRGALRYDGSMCDAETARHIADEYISATGELAQRVSRRLG